MPTNLIHIHHLDARYRVSRSLDNPSSLQHRLDRIATDLLARVWEDRIAHVRGGDEVIYFIKQMEVNLILDPSSGDDRALAETWACALHEGILRALSLGDSSVVVFRDRVAYVASFLEDLLRGRAWNQWYYHEFEHLRSLPLGQAAFRILSEDGDTGRDALIELTRRDDLDLLLAILTDAEVEVIVSKCLLPPGPTVILPNIYAEWIRSLRSLLAGQRFTLTSVLSRDVARLYLSLLRQRPELGPDVNLARFVRSLLQLRQAIVQMRNRRDFLSMVESEEWTGALNLLGRGDEQQFLGMLVREIGGPEIVLLLRDLQAGSPHTATRRISTQYGGIFLLAPTIAELGLQDFLQLCPYPEPQGVSKSGLLLFLIALQCLGRRNAEQAQRDEGLALFAGLSAPPTLHQLNEYAEGLVPDMHQAFSDMFQTYQIEIVNRPGVLKPRSIPSEVIDNSGWLWLSSGAEPFLPNREWDLALSMASLTALRWFASKLGAFSESSPEYLCRNFLESQADVEVFADRIAVHFLTCPLQMVLRMIGFDHTTWTVPWLEDRKLEFRFD